MATASRRRLPYHWRLFLLLLTFSWVLVAALVAFHYGREKHFKAELLNDRLQLVNTRLADALLAGASPQRRPLRNAPAWRGCASR